MGNKTLIHLKTDEEFQYLIPPKRKVNYSILEQKIKEEGCLEPIIVWNGYILDGHWRYKICQEHKIKYEIKMLEFESKTDACIWLAHSQLQRHDISEEYSRYLVGKIYEYERSKYENIKHPSKNQYSVDLYEENDWTADDMDKNLHFISGRQTAIEIGSIYHMSYTTIQKYGYYAKAIDLIRIKEPALIPKIMSGRTKISHNALMDLTKMSKEELRLLNERLTKRKNKGQYSQTREVLREQITPPKEVTSIKDMPNYDPDSSVVELSLTIPTWKLSIERINKITDFSLVSREAKNRLIDALTQLELTIENLISNAEEEL